MLCSTRQSLLPFETDILRIVNDDADRRAINWFYSRKGKMNKSRATDRLVEMYDAIVLKPGATQGSIDLVRKKKEESAKFEQKPIVVIDLPRSASTQSNKLYETLETIQGSFSDKKGTLTWSTPPHVLVFANDTPETGRLSADRLRVHLITSEYELVRAKHIETQLEEYDSRLEEEQKLEEAAAESGEMPPRLVARAAAGKGGAGGSGNSGAHHVRSASPCSPASPWHVTHPADQQCLIWHVRLAGEARGSTQAPLRAQGGQPTPLPPPDLRTHR